MTAHDKAHSYNQGQCSRKPCKTQSGPCSSLFWQCCYEVGQISSLPFSCLGSTDNLLGSVHVIESCECQPCNKLHASFRGYVLSSRGHQPVVLAAILLAGTEIVTFSDQNGRFFFELTTIEGGVHLLIQEVHHREVEVDIDLTSTLTPGVDVIMEYIEDVVVVEKFQSGARIELGDSETLEKTGLNGSIVLPKRSLFTSTGYSEYSGFGHILHSFYHMDSQPDFTSSALRSMVYQDSKGVDFTIQSHVSGSLRVLSDTGQTLKLKLGSTALIKVSIRFDIILEKSQVDGFHIFIYPEAGSHWVDCGKVTVNTFQQLEYTTLVTLHAKLRDINAHWVIGTPSRVTCYVKARVSHMLTKQEQSGISIQLEQTASSLDRPSLYLASARTVSGEGVCLKAVCSLGGLLYIKDTGVGDHVNLVALSPSTDHGVIMGDMKQVLFYDVDKTLVTSDSTTPYYPTEEGCKSTIPGENGYFEFLVNSSISNLIHRPSALPPVPAHSDAVNSLPVDHCYIKVASYDCSPYTSVQVLSFSLTDHSKLLSLTTTTDNNEQPRHNDGGGGGGDRDCQESNVMPSSAYCLTYTCGSDVHVTVTTTTIITAEGPDAGVGKECRYWSSHPSLTKLMNLTESMTAFHLKTDVFPRGAGLYQDTSEELSQLQCLAGDVHRPSKIMDQHQGVAVTFTC